MAASRYDILAIGNALIDVLCHKDDDFVAAQGLARGVMQPIAPDRAIDLHQAMGQCEEICGGSAANTMAALARLGLRIAFIGQVGDDRLGRLFSADMASSGIDFPLPPIAMPTGRCLIIVSPDGHRTMNTAMGASEFLPACFDPALAAEASILFVEGYMWRTEQPRAASRAALEAAREAGRRTAFSLSSEFCVRTLHDEFAALIEAGLVDILLANEGEITELSRLADFEAGIAWAATRVPLLVVTRGADGAIAIEGGSRRIETPAEPQGPVVDTTGAGDLFAAGLLAGLARHRGLPTALRMGSIAAGRIIGVMGPRLPDGEDLAGLIEARLKA